MLLNNDIQFVFYSNDFIVSKGNKWNYVHYWNFKKKNLNHSLWQNFNKISILKVYVIIMFKMKYLINRMQCNTLSQKMGYFDNKGVCFHFEGQGIKPYKWCVHDQ